MIELKQWQALSLFAKTGSLTRTAEEMMISQPAMSVLMKHTEQEMGIALFVRTGHNRMMLTEAGRKAARYGLQLTELAEKACREVRETARRIGICAPALRFFLEDTLLVRDPEWICELVSSDEDLLAGLREGRFEAVILHESCQDPDLLQEPVFNERLSLGVPSNHPLASRNSIRLQDLEGQNLLLHSGIGFWKDWVKKRLPDSHFAWIDDYDAFRSATLVGAFPFFTTDAVWFDVPDNVRVIPVDDPETEADYWLTCSTDRRELFDRLRSSLRQPE